METKVRFRFRGCDRESGKPVEGEVEAFDSEAAYQTLSDHGIVTEFLDEELKPLKLLPTAIPDFAQALDSALDSSSSQVAFDDLTKRYRGRKVWVIDREKIRHRVAQVVDSTLAASEANPETGADIRERVAEAINELFHDTGNIASQHNALSIAKLRALVGAAGADAKGIDSMTNADLSEQIGRLSGVVEQAEGLIAAMSAALRNIETGGAPRRRIMAAADSIGPEQNEVLREIFQANLDLRRSIVTTPPPRDQAA